ncbi:hypothetical protein LCGC14_3121240 [marine sediment metagenome]|uniref:Uncharacterized protein n=1 Tax=marine sediment metagenome TaxID=412755 RepID=A0A0F8W281_9ZZZZ
MTVGKTRALVGCQNEDCAAEVSYHLDMVRRFEGGPICSDCYDERTEAIKTLDENATCALWGELPAFTLSDLCE